MLNFNSWKGQGSRCYSGSTAAELAIYGVKERLKRTSTEAEPGNADVERKVHYLTNFSYN